MRAHAALALVLALSAGPALAGDVTAGAITVRHPWARATPAGAAVAGGYATIVNAGPSPDRLTGGSFAAATGFALHEMAMTDGVMRMRPVGPLEIPAGATVTLAPAGRHIMLTGLKHGLKKGATIEGTLVFDHAGTVPVTFTVEGIGAKAPAMPGMDMN